MTTSDACLLCCMGFKIPVSDFGWKNKYSLTENLFKIPQSGVDKIRPAGLENTCCVEVDPQEGKS